MIVDSALYRDGVRVPVACAKEDLSTVRDAASDEGDFIWVGLHEPTSEELDEVAKLFELHPLAVEDALHAHQRPKLEVYGGDLFVVLKTARYVEDDERVEFAEIQAFVGENYIVTVRHGAASALADVRAMLEDEPAHLVHGPTAVLHAIVDRVVDDYEPVIAGLDNDMREIELEVFSDDHGRGNDPSKRIYQLKREVLDFHRHTKPLLEGLDRLQTGSIRLCVPELCSYFRDVADHLLKVVGEIEHFADLLSDALDANLAQAAVRQNNDMRKISAWVAVGAIPTVVGAIYGMNFEHMPELGTRYGYPVVLLVTVVACFTLYRRFKRVGWL